MLLCLDLRFEIVSIILTFLERLVCSMKFEMCCIGFLVNCFKESCGLKKKRKEEMCDLMTNC